MKSKIVKSIVIILFISCGNNSNSDKLKELELKEKELELKERELNIKEKSILEPKKNKRELRYLFFANGGIVGYFDDGTISGCPRCDFNKSNIVSMFDMKPHGKYTVEADGSLLINGTEKEIPTNGNDGWALIDYKWYKKPPQN